MCSAQGQGKREGLTHAKANNVQCMYVLQAASPPPLDPPCSFGIARGRSPKREVQLIERAEPKYPPFSLSDRNVRKQFGEIVSRSPPFFFCRSLSVFFGLASSSELEKGEEEEAGGRARATCHSCEGAIRVARCRWRLMACLDRLLLPRDSTSSLF